MKKLIQKIREKKGFTLAELLIVVAFIAVLVAIAIPIFTTQLERSRDAASIANLRAAYAEAATSLLTWDGTSTTVDGNAISKSGNVTTIVIEDVAIKSQQGNNWSGQGADLPFAAPNDPGDNTDHDASFKYDSSTDSWTVTL